MTNTIYNLLDRLPSYRAKSTTSNTYKFMKGFADEFDIFNDECYNATSEIFVDTADGNYLNSLALLFNLYRISGETDTVFRARIKSHFLTYSGSGTQVEIMNTAAQILNNGTSNMSIYELAPLKFSLRMVITTTQIDLLSSLESSVLATKAAGTRMFIYFSATPPVILGIFTAGVSTLGGPWVA